MKHYSNFLQRLDEYEGDPMEFLINHFIEDKPKDYYVYILVNPITGRAFYVGKGLANRCYIHGKETNMTTTNRNKFNIIQEIKNSGNNIQIRFYQQSLPESDAYDLEKKLIKRFSGELANIKEGRNGTYNKCFNFISKMIELVKLNRRVHGEKTIMPKACSIFNSWNQNG